MSTQIELFRSAKRVIARNPELTDAQVGEQWGLKPFQVSHVELGTIRSARREVVEAREAAQSAARDQQRLRAQMPWIEG